MSGAEKDPSDPSLPINSIGTCARCGYQGPGPRHDCKPTKRKRESVVDKPTNDPCHLCGERAHLAVVHRDCIENLRKQRDDERAKTIEECAKIAEESTGQGDEAAYYIAEQIRARGRE